MAVFSLLFVLAIFGCVLLHELGHALAARQFGIATRDITLLPIGGLAMLQRMPRNPFQELWIAIAGPLVNVVIAIVVFTGLALSPVPTSGGIGRFLWQLGAANVVLVLFNLIPAFPMDGGRVLRSVLAMFMDYVSATRIATVIGQFSAVGLGLLGLASGNFMLLLIAGFVFLAARAENLSVANSRYQPTSPIQYIEPRQYFDGGQSTSPNGISFMDEEPVPSSLTVTSVAAWLANQHRDYCPVVESGHVIGRITMSQLVAAIYRGLGRVPVGQLVMTLAEPTN